MISEKEKAKKLRASNWWLEKIEHGRCYYCNNALSSKTVTMDHVVPLSRGGKSKKGNIVACCKSCNSLKKDMTSVELLLFKTMVTTEE